MYKQKLCLNLQGHKLTPDSTMNDEIRLYKRIGFDGFFTMFDCDIESLKQTAREEGMIYQSLHAPWGMCAKMWEDAGEAGEAGTRELIGYVETCAKHEIELMISHVYVGFDHQAVPTEFGLIRYGRVIERAAELGVSIAFENTEGLECLDAILKEYKSCKNVGFCLDTGHEMCYNYSVDLLALYGDKLIATHFNDNLGINDYNGVTTYHDDFHLLPFDGAADWNDIAARVVKCGFSGPLTFELGNKRGYSHLSTEAFLDEQYKRACRLAMMINRLTK